MLLLRDKLGVFVSRISPPVLSLKMFVFCVCVCVCVEIETVLILNHVSVVAS